MTPLRYIDNRTDQKPDQEYSTPLNDVSTISPISQRYVEKLVAPLVNGIFQYLSHDRCEKNDRDSGRIKDFPIFHVAEILGSSNRVNHEGVQRLPDISLTGFPTERAGSTILLPVQNTGPGRDPLTPKDFLRNIRFARKCHSRGTMVIGALSRFPGQRQREKDFAFTRGQTPLSVR
ncbi:hypothetical protein HZH68_013717 [Vespula germanica]|uniref:Uncharacterized protein n=1 Tax=Vespula germanica TaxID=30212 RepID=A0A834JDR6_VESGE|nr:hypothetical protein HZH68_013717 [Vespula germanica]